MSVQMSHMHQLTHNMTTLWYYIYIDQTVDVDIDYPTGPWLPHQMATPIMRQRMHGQIYEGTPYTSTTLTNLIMMTSTHFRLCE